MSMLTALGSSAVLSRVNLPGKDVRLVSSTGLRRVGRGFDGVGALLTAKKSTKGAVLKLSYLKTTANFVKGIKGSGCKGFFHRGLRGGGVRSGLLLSSLPSKITSAFVSSSNRHAFKACLKTTSALETRSLSLSVFGKCTCLCVRKCLMRSRSVVLHTVGLTGRTKLRVYLSVTDCGVIRKSGRFFSLLVDGCMSVMFTGRRRTGTFANGRPRRTLRVVNGLYDVTVIGVNYGNSLVHGNARRIEMSTVPMGGIVSAANTNSCFTTKFLCKLAYNCSLRGYTGVNSVLSKGIVRIVKAAVSGRH